VFLFTNSFLDIPSNWVLQKIRPKYLDRRPLLRMGRYHHSQRSCPKLLWRDCVSVDLVATVTGRLSSQGACLPRRRRGGVFRESRLLFEGTAAHWHQPAAVFITSVWYPRKQVQWRVAIFYCMGSLSGSFTGLIAYGVAHMDGRAGLASWRESRNVFEADLVRLDFHS
jgi:hypothetical protein